MKNNCARNQNSKGGCEFYDNGICRGVVFTSYPPQYKKCAFDMKDDEDVRYFTEADIIEKKHLKLDDGDKIEKTDEPE